ncbi:hypothetical protein IQ07DRAFT_647258 [Pyrenochaeta sp. DS3sAY3a]|nr:hypothetical protein IQ07DRAFT_647258 [Pyrenochaeta sp. DS3sAY3a]
METEDAAQPATPTIEIARNGNVILVIGPQQKRIRVCSMVLSNASRYFQAMFGPHFSEGQGLTFNPADPKEIEMPEDDADALELVCCIIHVRNDVVPNVLAPQKLLEFLATADKFECLIAMRFIGRIWLSQQLDGQHRPLKDYAAQIIAAYVLDHPSSFTKATWRFIKHWDGSLTDLQLPTAGFDISDNLYWHIIYAITAERTRFYTKFVDILAL